MSKITIIGDIHGKTQQYQKILRQKYSGQRTIQVGDMGIGFSGVGLHDLASIPGDHRWFRGNHDDPDKCYTYKSYLGDYGFLPKDSLFWLAGAFSIDRAWRVPGVSWWAGEELSSSELQKAIDIYIQAKPRFVISHEAPSEAAKYMLTVVLGGFRPEKLDCTMSRTSEALQVMMDAHQPEEWVFGHYHRNVTFPWKGTKFTCVTELSAYDLETKNETDHNL
jgi:predicted phosphohydrolase